jgi:hypothetical protein
MPDFQAHLMDNGFIFKKILKLKNKREKKSCGAV